MNKKLLEPAVQEFLLQNKNADFTNLLLKKSPFSDVTIQELVQQLNGRKIAERKFPFLNRPGILFPPNLNLEQTSSAATAAYKANLLSGNRFADLTSGFGIDAYFISKNFKETVLVEQDAELIETVKFNWNTLGRQAQFFNQKLDVFLEENSTTFDAVYLDPARRDHNKKKVFLLEDLSPDIRNIQGKLAELTPKTLIKLSPLIDLQYLIQTLPNITEIHIVAVRNDVKEILIMLEAKKTSDVKISCVNLETQEPEFHFFWSESRQAQPVYGEIDKYLYIPNNSVLKSGAFNLIAEKFNLIKLHPNTHLYASAEKMDLFPGRILEVEEISANAIVKGAYFNIISKNHPLTAEEIAKKYKLKTGGGDYLIFTQTKSRKIILKSHS